MEREVRLLLLCLVVALPFVEGFQIRKQVIPVLSGGRVSIDGNQVTDRRERGNDRPRRQENPGTEIGLRAEGCCRVKQAGII